MYTVSEGKEVSLDLVREAINYDRYSRKSIDDKFLYTFDELEEYYDGEHPILNRQKIATLKNNKLIINHAKYITDVFTGYFMGDAVEYQAYDELDISGMLEEFRKHSIGETDYEIANGLSKFGKFYEYVYSDEEGGVLSKAIDPRNCIIAYDDTIHHNKVFAVIYKREYEENEVVYKNVTVLTDSEIWIVDESFNKKEVYKHYFDEVPIIEYKNSSNDFGDFEPVIPLINAYNILQSDRVNDKEQLVDALLVLYGFDLETEESMEAGRRRVLGGVPEEGRVEYLTKSLNEADTDVLRNSIKEDIHKISMVPDMTDENFVANSSGVAIKYKLLPFEQATKRKERYFERGLMERWSLYNNFLVKKSGISKIENYQVDAIFKRSLPQNDLEVSQMIVNLGDKADDETLLNQLSFIGDASKVVEKKKEEKEEAMNWQLPQFGTTEATQNEVGEKIDEKAIDKQETLLNKIKNIFNE